MTFYELENICKKRKRKIRIILLFVFVLLMILLYFGWKAVLLEENKQSKKTIKKTVNKIKKKEIKRKQKIQKPQNTKLLPLIDLELNERIKRTVKIKKEKSVKTKKEKTNTEQKDILQSSNIPSFKTCINLAKKYFEMQDYKNALKWAKLANIQNKKNPASWILSAKALYKQGKKEEALKLLKIYNTYYNNNEIKKLIKEINEN